MPETTPGKKSVVFMGTPDFAVSSLEAVVDAGHRVVAVYCQPPRPAGRGQKDRPCPVQQRAESLGLPVRHPNSLKGAEEQQAFAALGADVAVVAAYGLILPRAILDAPRWGCLNVHASLLPRWRGAAPIQRAIMAGDSESGVTIMQMEAGLDTGPMLLKHSVVIGPRTTASDLHDTLAACGATLLVQALERLETLTATPQPEHGITYATKIDKAEARISFAAPAQGVARHINGLSPFPGAWLEARGERVKVLLAEPGPATFPRDSAPGTVLAEEDTGLVVACLGGESVRLLRLQRSGKGAQDAATFRLGFSLPPGTVL